jgi:hypothetical protein
MALQACLPVPSLLTACAYSGCVPSSYPSLLRTLLQVHTRVLLGSPSAYLCCFGKLCEGTPLGFFVQLLLLTGCSAMKGVNGKITALLSSSYLKNTCLIIGRLSAVAHYLH